MLNPSSFVPPEGPLDAQIAVVGEAPGKVEVFEGRPFVGPSGWRLNMWLNLAGIARVDCRIMNIHNQRLPNDDFSVLWQNPKQTVPTEALKNSIIKLYSELSQMSNLKMIIALGRQPMYILTGKDGITKWRGSILPLSESFKFMGLHSIPNIKGWVAVKVIPTYHPAYIQKIYTLNPLCVLDVKKAKHELNIDGLNYKEYTYNPQPSFIDIITVLSQLIAKHYPKHITIDIETIPGTYIMHRFGVSINSEQAISIPFIHMESGKNWWTVEEEAEIWMLIDSVCRSQYYKVLQNGLFDIIWLNKYGIKVSNFKFDTKIAQHVILPGIFNKIKPLSLATLTSIWTREPYYKDEGALKKKESKVSDENNGIYNCKDCVITHEVMEAQSANKVFQKRKATFDFEMALLNGPIHWMMQRGVKIDTKYKDEMREECESQRELISLRAQHVVGRKINIASPQQVAAYLYDELHLQRGNKRTVDEDQLKILHAIHPDLSILTLIVQHRKLSKTLGNYWNMRVDDDGRVRCEYSPTTDSGRFKSYKNPFGSGTNLQNIDRRGLVRRMFIADDGFTLLNFDLEQAELRGVAYYANSSKLINMLEQEGIDVHAQMAKDILGKPSVTYEERQLGKKIVHAANYLMGPRTFVATCRKELGLNMKETEAKRLLNNYHIQYPSIRIWHKSLEAKLYKNGGRLTNAWGRERVFFEHPGHERLGTAVSFLPQGITGDLLNRIMLSVYNKLNQLGQCELLLQVHDSFIVQAPEGTEAEWINKILPYFDIHADINGHDVVIPTKVEIGKTWGDLKEVKI